MQTNKRTHRRVLALIAAFLVSLSMVAFAGASPASASSCVLTPRGGPHKVNWPGTQTWAVTSPQNNRQTCFVAAIEGKPGDRYINLVWDVQDTIDTGAGNDQHWVCAEFTTPGTTVWHVAACDVNSADWLKNGSGINVGIVVDTWASGGPCGFKTRVRASDSQKTWILAGPANIQGCWW